VYIIDRVKEVENRYIDFHILDQKFKHADTLELWKLVNPLVSLLRTATGALSIVGARRWRMLSRSNRSKIMFKEDIFSDYDD